ncbi:MAG: pyridoxal phosphate-dependent aminotransferase [Gemmatimonadaceae bacterium]|nr:pyridoxal phosphate-dependent aminotransferase [Gemmatimonadaceae bacterium]
MSRPADPFTPSLNIAQLKESATIAASARARALKAAGRTIIDLGIGEPDFATPVSIRAAAAAAVEAGATKYTATEGILPLREAIAREAAGRWKGPLPISATDVVVSGGSKQSLFNACFSLFGPGDEVLIPTPSWTSYYEIVGLTRATAVSVMGDPADGYRVNAATLAAHATERTRGLMLNSPCNPTGAVYSAAALREILALAADRGWWVISDEIYRHIAYDAPATTAFDVATDRDRLIIVDGVAKSYAMTGWRIGWTVSAPAVAKAMTALQSHTTSNPAAVSQHAALAALNGGEAVMAEVRAMVSAFHARRDAALRILQQEPAIQIIPPDGAFYLYFRAPGDAPDAGTRFADRLLEQHGIAIVTGAAFGTPQWVRASYATAQPLVEKAMRAIVAAWRDGAVS